MALAIFMVLGLSAAAIAYLREGDWVGLVLAATGAAIWLVAASVLMRRRP